MGLDLSLARKRENLPDICVDDAGKRIDESEWTSEDLDFDEVCDEWEYVAHFYHAGYMTLHVIRQYIAAIEGIDLERMPGYRDPSFLYKYRHGFEPTEAKWEDYPTTLLPLLLHSDCDGELSPDECKQMAPRLRQILDVAPEWVNRYEQMKDLIEGIERAAAEDLWILFR